MKHKTIWQTVCTAAIDLPAEFHGRWSILSALETAQWRASQMARWGTPEWYAVAIDEIKPKDAPAQRWVIAQLSAAYRKGRKEVLADEQR